MNEVKVEQLTKEELVAWGVNDWPVWEKEVSTFDWTYSSQEQCLILEGEAEVETPHGVVHIKSGDFVTFPKGLICVWKGISPVKKRYNFN